MGAMDARRLELYELLKPKLDEEPARALVLALPATADELATKNDLATMLTGVDARFESLESRLDARFAQLEATLTRRMVSILGGWTVIVGSTVGWVAVLLR